MPLLALPAGQLADRVSRRAITAVSLVLDVGIAALLLVVTLEGTSALWPFLAVGAIAGVASAVGNPATRALTPELVPPEILQNALVLRNVAGQIGVVAGPALGGVIFAVEPVAVYAIAAGLFVVALVAIRRAAAPGAPGLAGAARLRQPRRRRPLHRQDEDAARRDRARPLRRPARRLDRARAGVRAVDPPHRADRARRCCAVAPSVGALTAGLMLARKPLQRAAGPTMLVVVASFGAGMIVFGLSKSLPLSLAALAVHADSST